MKTRRSNDKRLNPGVPATTTATAKAIKNHKKTIEKRTLMKHTHTL